MKPCVCILDVEVEVMLYRETRGKLMGVRNVKIERVGVGGMLRVPNICVKATLWNCAWWIYANYRIIFKRILWFHVSRTVLLSGLFCKLSDTALKMKIKRLRHRNTMNISHRWWRKHMSKVVSLTQPFQVNMSSWDLTQQCWLLFDLDIGAHIPHSVKIQQKPKLCLSHLLHMKSSFHQTMANKPSTKHIVAQSAGN